MVVPFIVLCFGKWQRCDCGSEIFFLKIIYLLKGRVTERESVREKNKDNLPFTGSILKWLELPAILVQSQEFH